MHSVTVRGEFTAPTFLRGNDKAELRIPSIRGALRYWYRAILGGVGVDSVEELKSYESKVFGDTETQSPVLFSLESENIHPNPRAKIINKFSYLWPDFFLGNYPKVILDDSSFTMRLVALDKQALEHALCALWCLSWLGGLGYRSRKAAGGVCFEVLESSPGIECPFDFQVPTDPSAVKTVISSNLSQIIKKVRKDLNLETKTRTVKGVYDHFGPGNAMIFYLPLNKSDWKGVLEQLENSIKEYTRPLPPNYGKNIPFRVALGIPKSVDKMKIQERDIDNKPLDRRTSTVWFRIIKRGSAYDMVSTAFETQYHTLEHGGRQLPVSSSLKQVSSFMNAIFQTQYEVSL